MSKTCLFLINTVNVKFSFFTLITLAVESIQLIMVSLYNLLWYLFFNSLPLNTLKIDLYMREREGERSCGLIKDVYECITVKYVLRITIFCKMSYLVKPNNNFHSKGCNARMYTYSSFYIIKNL